MVSPIQYTGDSEGYLGVARMLLGQSAHGIAPIYRTPGYPILLALSGAAFPGTFIPLLFIQALCAATVPVIIYRILMPYGSRLALCIAMIAIFSGTTTIHTSQIMTEPLFTFLLFVGIYITIKIIRQAQSPGNLLYWLAFIFAAMNTVRPIAWPIFWIYWLLIAYNYFRQKQLARVVKKLLGSIFLFMSLMCLWGVVDDILLSNGAYYSPLVTKKDHFLENYVYDIPFIEAYFSPWTKQVNHIKEFPISFHSPPNNTAMKTVHTILLRYIEENKDRILNEQSHYSYQLFGQYLSSPQQLVFQIFNSPNHIYASFVQEAMNHYLSKKERFALYYAVAKKAHRTWPQRWLENWDKNPLFLLAGPTHGNGSQRFLLAYSPLRHYFALPPDKNAPSLVNATNGPASQFLLTTLRNTLTNNPELWRGTSGIFGLYVDHPEQLAHVITKQPNQQYAWDIAVMLWDLMGYNNMTRLLDQVAKETFTTYKQPLLLRIWETFLMVAAGPGYVEFDNLEPQFGQVEIYDYLETNQLSNQQKHELRSAKVRYQAEYAKWQSPVAWGYFIFYLSKPFFLLASFISLFILWARKQSLTVPIVLLIPYCICISAYGTFFTALPRYTDPTLLLPMIVTALTFPECLRIHRERKYKTIEKYLQVNNIINQT